MRAEREQRRGPMHQDVPMSNALRSGSTHSRRIAAPVPHRAAWPLVFLLAIAAGSSAGSRAGLQAPLRSIPADTFVVEPAPPIAGFGSCARDSGAPDAGCSFLYRAVLVGKLHRSGSGTKSA